jgi:uncharacterized protein Yka (UPF0111/DUF47 family)
MAKIHDDFYFNNFIESAQIASEAAQLLKNVLVHFDPATLPDEKARLHEIEHKGDDKRHELTQAVTKAFITPIERDDLLRISQNLDDVTDSIEDVVIHIYMNNITSIRPDSIEFADIIIHCCDALAEMMREFPKFKKSRRLQDLIVEINHQEELGDDKYVSCMRALHTDPKDAIEVISWREIYDFLENCCDTCENVADIVEGIAIGNT